MGKLAIVTWSKDSEGKDDGPLFTGTAVLRDSGLSLKRSDESSLELRDEGYTI